jgi:RNA polymerase primary sigma factor
MDGDVGGGRTSGRAPGEDRERQFREYVAEIVELHRQGRPSNVELGSRGRRSVLERLSRIGSKLELRDDALLELGQRVKASYPPDHLTFRAISDAERRGNAARDEFVRCNMRLVVSVAKRFVGNGLSLGDLVQEGSLGLLRAVEKFDPSRGYRFSTYATWWVRQAMGRALSNQARTIRVPVHTLDLVRQLRQAQRASEQKTGKRATATELGAMTGLDPSKVEDLSHLVKEPLSLDAPVGAETDVTLGDFVADAEDGPVQRAIAADIGEHLLALVGRLNGREQMIVRLRYGLDGRGQRTLKEIGDVAGVSRERIRQLEIVALRKLRRLAPALLRETKD